MALKNMLTRTQGSCELWWILCRITTATFSGLSFFVAKTLNKGKAEPGRLCTNIQSCGAILIVL